MARKEAGGRSSQQNDFLEPKQPIIDSAINTGTNRPFASGQVIVTVSLPAGSPEATSYEVTATPAAGSPVVVSNATSPITLDGLENSTTYTFTATASNAAGTSAASVGVDTEVTTVP